MPTQHTNVCPHDCWDTCSMKVTVDDEGKAIKIRGNEEHPVTKGFLCVKVNHYLDRVYHSDRILFPMKRAGQKGEGKFERISWEEAIGTICTQFKETIEKYGAQAVLPYSYAGTMGILNYSSMDRRFFGRMGASSLARTICLSAAADAYALTYGKRWGVDPEDIIHSRLIIAWGTNTLATNVHQWPIIEEARKRGAKLVVIDPYKHETARRADLYLQIKPGTDSAFALGLMHVLINENLIDHEYIDQHVHGYSELDERVKDYTPERVAEITGITKDQLLTLARLYGTTKPSILRVGFGLQRHTNGGEIIRSLSLLPALTGAWKEIGGGMLLFNMDAFQVNYQKLFRSDIYQGNPREINCVQLASALHDQSDPVNMMYVYNSNPASVTPDSKRVRAGLMRQDLFLVVHEQMMTDTCRYADILLPATTTLEHLDLHTSYWHLYVQLNEPSIAPLGEAKPNTEAFRLLAQGMGYEEECFKDSDEDLIRQALDTQNPTMSGITYEALKERKFIKLNYENEHFMPHEKGFHTPTGKIEAYSTILEQVGLDPLIRYTPVKESAQASPQRFSSYPLHFITPAAKHFLNSTFGNVEILIKREKEPVIFIHPDDAAIRGITDDDLVNVYNDRGEVTLRARIHDTTAKGVVISPSIWWKQNVNFTTSEELSDLGGGATFHTNLVEVKKNEPIK